MTALSSIWRGRIPLLASLAAVILIDVALLVSYRAFYDTRVSALVETKGSLESRRNDLRARVDKLAGAEERIARLRDGLEEFFGETLGTRKERLIPLIDEIHHRTRAAGLLPKTIGYSEALGTGDLDVIRMSFALDGRYADVKGLLADFERSPRFLVVQNLNVSPDGTDPNIMHATLTLMHFFRSESSRLGTQARRAEGDGKPGATSKPAGEKASARAKAVSASGVARATGESSPRGQAQRQAGGEPAAVPRQPEARAARREAPTPAATGAARPTPKPGAPMRGLIVREAPERKKVSP